MSHKFSYSLMVLSHTLCPFPHPQQEPSTVVVCSLWICSGADCSVVCPISSGRASLFKTQAKVRKDLFPDADYMFSPFSTSQVQSRRCLVSPQPLLPLKWSSATESAELLKRSKGPTVWKLYKTRGQVTCNRKWCLLENPDYTSISGGAQTAGVPVSSSCVTAGQ